MRIIAGKFRGRKLRTPAGLDIRPTGDRLKQTLFDILGPDVSGRTVIDAFAGSGAIGLEALSRGAREIIFIESGKESCRLIRRNLELCGVASGYRLLEQDVFAALRYLGREGHWAHVIFLDPPYDWEPYEDLLKTIFRFGLAREVTRVVIEHHRRAILPEEGSGYRCARRVRQSDKCLSFFSARLIQE